MILKLNAQHFSVNSSLLGQHITTPHHGCSTLLHKMTFGGRVEGPAILLMSKGEQTKPLEALKSWEEECEESSPAGLACEDSQSYRTNPS